MIYDLRRRGVDLSRDHEVWEVKRLGTRGFYQNAARASNRRVGGRGRF
jgi:hypothetical protein